MDIIGRKIKDQRFKNLIWKTWKAGFGERGKIISANIIGIPQGSIISPLLCNIYMNEFDKYLETLKVDFNLGDKPKINLQYHRLSTQKRRAIINGELYKVKI